MTGREWKSCGLERMGRREIGEMGRERRIGENEDKGNLEKGGRRKGEEGERDGMKEILVKLSCSANLNN